MNVFYLETDEGIVRDSSDFQTPLEFIKSFTGSISWVHFPPKCILNEFLVSEVELYDILNNPNKEDRIFTDKELEFRKGNLEFSLDDIFYAWDIENSNQLQIHIADYENWKKRHAEWCRNHQPLNRDKIVEEEKNKVIRELAAENRILSSDRVCLREENDFLRSELRKLKNQPQKAIDSSEKPLATREKKTLLKLLRAAIELDDRRKIDKRGLAGALARKTQLLYKDSPVSERTVEIKIKEISDLQD